MELCLQEKQEHDRRSSGSGCFAEPGEDRNMEYYSRAFWQHPPAVSDGSHLQFQEWIGDWFITPRREKCGSKNSSWNTLLCFTIVRCGSHSQNDGTHCMEQKRLGLIMETIMDLLPKANIGQAASEFLRLLSVSKNILVPRSVILKNYHPKAVRIKDCNWWLWLYVHVTLTVWKSISTEKEGAVLALETWIDEIS